MPTSWQILYNGDFALLGWNSHNTHILPLDATHSLLVGFTGTTASGPVQAVVIEHSNPAAIAVGTPVTVSVANFNTSGDDYDLSLAPDGVTVAWSGQNTGFAGTKLAFLTWNGAMGLTVAGPFPNNDTTSANPSWTSCCMVANDRVLVQAPTGPGDYALYSWSGGFVTRLDIGTSPVADEQVYRLDNTHAVGVSTTGIRLVDITGGVVTFPAGVDAAFAYGQRPRPTTTNPLVFRGYGNVAGVPTEFLYTFSLAGPSLTVTTPNTFTSDYFGGLSGYDVDGVTSLGIDTPGMLVAGYSGDSSGGTLLAVDYSLHHIGPLTPIASAGGSVWGTQRLRNIGDGLVLISGDGNGSGSDGFVVVYEFSIVPGSATGLVWGVIPLG